MNFSFGCTLFNVTFSLTMYNLMINNFQIIWMSINIALFVSTYLNYGTTKKYHYLRIIIKVC